MDQLITNIYKILEDYREDENNPNVRITPECIRIWIEQFEDGLRIPILTELQNIFKKRYCSKKNIKKFLGDIVLKLTEDFKFDTPEEFLENSNFLDLQPAEKSQKVMLALFNELIQEKYGMTINDCGTKSKKYSIYIDDILCTGLTLINDIKEWSEEPFSNEKTNKQAIADNSTKLVFTYVFMHNKNYLKKKAEMKHKISKEVSLKHTIYRIYEIENTVEEKSKIDLILPVENNEYQDITEYKEKIIDDVNNYTRDRKYPDSKDEFFRPSIQPRNEQFYTSSENRILVENAFLKKGIEILNKANARNNKIRAIGYSIPSLKNFGFGALCFTWRNVPNNAPLVFWYSGGGFKPLFKVTRSH